MPHTADLRQLGEAIWTWRAATQPISGDDIPRIERPAGWLPDWSPDSIAERRTRVAEFEREHAALGRDVADWSVAEQVDYRLLGSALARVRWEIDVVRGWQRNPHFYIHQTLGLLFDALIQPPPFDAERASSLIQRVEGIPATLDAAQDNLAGEAIQPFAKLAIGALDNIGARLHDVSLGLTPLIGQHAGEFASAVDRARAALDSYAEWLRGRLGSMRSETAIGREAYVGFLRSVALIALTPEQIVASAEQELARSIAFEALEAQRNRKLPPPTLPSSVEEQIANERRDEQQLRSFCEEHDLLTFPKWLQHYLNLPMPAYMAPLRGVAVSDDLTSPSRLHQDGVHYIPVPRPDLPYFYLAMARDPRTLIAHEGMHYYQLALSWAHPDVLRRFYYDSGPNEGIGFYAEEMLLQAGLFDDRPRSREIIYNMMRLRALRVGVDVGLALGRLTIDSAAEALAQRVPMDIGTAREEASFFASEPGQAITYHLGKLQILDFLAAARRAQGDSFSLRAFHDALFLNGNVPISLERWELLGLRDQVPD